MEDNSVTNILLMNKENCALKLVDEIILYYDARSKKHQIRTINICIAMECFYIASLNYDMFRPLYRPSSGGTFP